MLRDQPRVCGEYPLLVAMENALCGEHACRVRVVTVMMGSAPRMRGIPSHKRRFGEPLRISPACAGNTSPCGSVSNGTGGQPRTCGNTLVAVPLAWVASGQPRTRGNTPHVQLLQDALTGQPRTRGEYVEADTDQHRRTGSAPHTRGIQCAGRVAGDDLGVSPAHAGNTPNGIGGSGTSPGQPRTCGEYMGISTRLPSIVGSAPHMRGIHCPDRRHSAVGAVRSPPVSFDSLFTCHAATGDHAGSRSRHGMRHRSGGWMPAFRHASAMQRSVSVRSCDAGTLRSPWANASRTAFADQPCSTARMAIP